MAMRAWIDPAPARQRMPLLKRLFWVYFLLLIFEGALRKWILPQLSAPLLIVRDPVALLIIWEAYRTHKWPQKWSLATGVLAVGLLSLCVVQLVVLPNYPWYAAVYGLRSYLLPFPVAFIMGENLDWEDLRKFGKWTLLLLLPLTLLEAVQYRSSAGSWWNKAASEGATQLLSAGGHMRASATFSYVTGPVFYLSLASAFLFYGFSNRRFVKQWLLWAGAASLVLAIPLTGSRTLIYEMAGLVICMGIGAFFGVAQFTRSIRVIAALALVLIPISRLPVFSSASDTLMERFTQASEQEGNIQHSLNKRIFRPFTMSLAQTVATNDLIGMGMAVGTNAITRLATGSVQFIAGEEETMRMLIELGWPCGLAFLGFRFFLLLTIVARAFGRLREQDSFAWLLSPSLAFLLTQGLLDQPTEQGFLVMCMAFAIAATRHHGTHLAVAPSGRASLPHPPPTPRVRILGGAGSPGTSA